MFQIRNRREVIKRKTVLRRKREGSATDRNNEQLPFYVTLTSDPVTVRWATESI